MRLRSLCPSVCSVSVAVLVGWLVIACSDEAAAPFDTTAQPAGDCDPTTYVARCVSNQLTTCEAGTRITRDCGRFTCNEVAGTCGYCGDGILDPHEACDDANLNDNDGCRNDCTLGALCDPASFAPRCQGATGNVLVLCDRGVEVPHACGAGTCNAAAGRCGVCGDGVRDPGEQCDDANTNDADGCRTDCTAPASCDPATFLPRCDGNTLVRCDMGLEVPTVCGALACDPTRGRCGSCGDSVLDPGEECDYPDLTEGDGCDTNCTFPRCGNGVRDPGEVCEDGNETYGDGCRGDCAGIEVCGDGLVDSAVGEQCDEGSLNGDETVSCDDCVLTPRTHLLSGPAELVGDAQVSFEFDSSLPSAVIDGVTVTGSFECAVDGAAWEPCSSPWLVETLDGEHVFEVRALLGDAVDLTPARATWTTDLNPPLWTTDPVTVVDEALGQAVITIDVTDQWSRIEAVGCLLDGTYECRGGLDPLLPSDGSHYVGVLTVPELSPGPHQVQLVAVDAFGSASPPRILDFEMTRGAGSGHVVIIGHDYEAGAATAGLGTLPGQEPLLILANAISTTPAAAFERPVRLGLLDLGYTDETAVATALDWLCSELGFDCTPLSWTGGPLGGPTGADVVVVPNQGGSDLTALAADPQWRARRDAFVDAGGVLIVLSAADGQGGASATYTLAAGLIDIASADLTGEETSFAWATRICYEHPIALQEDGDYLGSYEEPAGSVAFELVDEDALGVFVDDGLGLPVVIDEAFPPPSQAPFARVFAPQHNHEATIVSSDATGQALGTCPVQADGRAVVGIEPGGSLTLVDLVRSSLTTVFDVQPGDRIRVDPDLPVFGATVALQAAAPPPLPVGAYAFRISGACETGDLNETSLLVPERCIEGGSAPLLAEAVNEDGSSAAFATSTAVQSGDQYVGSDWTAWLPPQAVDVSNPAFPPYPVYSRVRSVALLGAPGMTVYPIAQVGFLGSPGTAGGFASGILVRDEFTSPEGFFGGPPYVLRSAVQNSSSADLTSVYLPDPLGPLTFATNLNGELIWNSLYGPEDADGGIAHVRVPTDACGGDAPFVWTFRFPASPNGRLTAPQLPDELGCYRGQFVSGVLLDLGFVDWGGLTSDDVRQDDGAFDVLNDMVYRNEGWARTTLWELGRLDPLVE
jgi:cysteine-rich repeat protein